MILHARVQKNGCGRNCGIVLVSCQKSYLWAQTGLLHRTEGRHCCPWQIWKRIRLLHPTLISRLRPEWPPVQRLVSRHESFRILQECTLLTDHRWLIDGEGKKRIWRFISLLSWFRWQGVIFSMPDSRERRRRWSKTLLLDKQGPLSEWAKYIKSDGWGGRKKRVTEQAKKVQPCTVQWPARLQRWLVQFPGLLQWQ